MVSRTGGGFEPTAAEKQDIIHKFGETNHYKFLNETGRKSIDHLTKKEVDLIQSFCSLDEGRKRISKISADSVESVSREYKKFLNLKRNPQLARAYCACPFNLIFAGKPSC